jgi:hypothetical protein
MPCWNVLQAPDVDPTTGSQKSKEYRAETAAALEDRTGSDDGSPGDFHEIVNPARIAVVSPRKTQFDKKRGRGCLPWWKLNNFPERSPKLTLGPRIL